jgi:hypothetical protein
MQELLAAQIGWALSTKDYCFLPQLYKQLYDQSKRIRKPKKNNVYLWALPLRNNWETHAVVISTRQTNND